VVPLDPVNINDQANFSVNVVFSDPAGALDEPYVCEFDVNNDGIIEDTQENVIGTTCSTPLAYSEPGVYTVWVSVTDKDGGQYTKKAEIFIVIYNPEGGFVTGGGWITSPEGAYTPDPMLTGKANFGFVAKYRKGTNVPIGNTEFQFKVADLNFHSTSYDWLVVAGKKAMYKGVGTINGEGEYKFMLMAIDGDLQGGDGFDKFRIKIWDAATGETIYDNQLGAEYDVDPTTVIGGGSIVIHNTK
jgi:hypothetical protein